MGHNCCNWGSGVHTRQKAGSMSVSNVLEHYLEARRNARVLNVPIAELQEDAVDEGYAYFFRDSSLFRRKQPQDVELLPSRPTESLPLAAGDEAIERRRWAAILDTEESEEQVPVLISRSLLACLVWLFLDYGINALLYQGNVVDQQKYTTPITWFILNLLYIAYISRKAFLDGSLDRVYGGWVANSWIGVRGTLDPARTIRQLPTCIFVAWLALRMAIFAAIPFSDPGISYCSGTLSDDCEHRFIAVALGEASIIFYLAVLLVIVTFRLDLCPGAHGALLQEAKAVIDIHPPIEDVLICAEMKVQSYDGLHQTRPWLHRAVCAVCGVYAIYTLAVILAVENNEGHVGAAAVVCMVAASVSIMFSLYALIAVTFGLSATYQACLVRVQMLSLFLYDHSIQNVRLLRAWWKLRVFYLRIVTPICYQSVQASATLLGLSCIFFLAILCYYAMNPPDLDYDLRMQVQSFLFLITLTLLTAPSAAVILSKASDIVTEQNRHVELLSRKAMGVRATHMGLQDIDDSSIHKAKRSLRKLRPDSSNEPTGDEGDVELLVDDMIEYIEKFDPKPTFLGLQLGPTTLKVLYGYIAAAVAFVLVTVLQAAHFETIFF